MTAAPPILPAGATDCHVHLFGPASRYPFAADRVYTPGDADEAALLALHRRLGVSRVVLVQPSPYGTDNSRMLDGLKALGPAARGIAVIGPDTPERALEAMHAAGVRGVRVNIATSGMDDPERAWAELEANARRVAHLGWHVQMLAAPGVIATLDTRLAELPTPLVVDHLGLADMDGDLCQPGFAALLRLVKTGRVLVKLSAIGRRAGNGRCARARPFIRALLEAGPAALVWGSDWPHTGGGRGEGRGREEIEPFMPLDDAEALAVLQAEMQDAGMLRRILAETPARLYDFPI